MKQADLSSTPEFVPTRDGGTLICPGAPGGQNGSYTAAYSPLAKLLFRAGHRELHGDAEGQGDVLFAAFPYWGRRTGQDPGAMTVRPTATWRRLILPAGKPSGRYVDDYPPDGAATLATAGGLVFTGNQYGYAMAF